MTHTPFSEEKLIAGGNIGETKEHRKYISELWKFISPDEPINIGYHGAGSRFFSENNLAEKCLKFLPEDEPEAFDIKPNFDVEMDLIGWYDTKDQSGGQNSWLKKTGNATSGYIDDRNVQKYYKKSNGKWLFAFNPKY